MKTTPVPALTLLALTALSTLMLSGCLQSTTPTDPAGASGAGGSVRGIDALDGVFLHLGEVSSGDSIALELDEPVWWDAAYVRESRALSCDVDTGSACLHWKIDVPSDAVLLRIGTAKPDHMDSWRLELIDPSGNEAWPRDQTPAQSAASSRANFLYSADARIDSPDAGTWTVRLLPRGVEEGQVRLRAVAQSDSVVEADGLPDLRPLPPWDFTFNTPIFGFPGVPYVPAGTSPTSCQAEEYGNGATATRCLRFSFGWGNVGPGEFEAELGNSTVPTSLPVTQVVHDGDKVTRHPAGTATLHRAHGHYHLDDAYQVEAFRVDGTSLGEAILSNKRGSCTADYVLMDWWSHVQSAKNTAATDCSAILPGTTVNPAVAKIGMSRGWADVYPWDLADNYIDMGGQPDGEYLFRASVDVKEHFLDANVDNNVAYAWVRVNGVSVTTLERGYGTDPWDENKVVFEPEWPAGVPAPVPDDDGRQEKNKKK